MIKVLDSIQGRRSDARYCLGSLARPDKIPQKSPPVKVSPIVFVFRPGSHVEVEAATAMQPNAFLLQLMIADPALAMPLDQPWAMHDNFCTTIPALNSFQNSQL